MSQHQLRALPDPSALPYGIVRINVWRPSGADEWVGDKYIAAGAEWRNERKPSDRLKSDEMYDWSLDGFSFTAFNRGHIRGDDAVPWRVRAALGCLERWAMGAGL